VMWVGWVVGCVTAVALFVRLYYTRKSSPVQRKHAESAARLSMIGSANKGKRTCLVTGASGFVGGHVIKALVGAFDSPSCILCSRYERVVAVDIRPPPPGLPSGDVGGVEVEWAVADIRDSNELELLLADVECVLHIASVVDTRSGPVQKEFLESVNVMGALTLLMTCDRLGVRRFVYTSSVASLIDDALVKEADEIALGRNGGEGKEWGEEKFTATVSNPLSPIAAYGDTKHRAELAILTWHAMHRKEGKKHTQVIALRPHLLYGERDAYFTEQVVLSTPAAPCTNGGSNRMVVCYGPNLAGYHIQADIALEKDSSLDGRVFFVGDELVPVRELYERLVTCRPSGPCSVSSVSASLLFPLAIFSEMLDWLTAGRKNWPLLQLNRNALRYAVGEYPFRLDAARQQIGTVPLFPSKKDIDERIRQHYSSRASP